MPNEPLTDADVMTGFNPDRSLSAEEIEAQQGDAETVEGAASEGAPSSEVDLTLDGRRFKAPKDIAEAFTREINRRDGTRGAEMQTLRERLARLEGAQSATQEKDDSPTEPQVPSAELQIENPEEYQRQLIAYITHQQDTRTRALAQQYEQAEAAKEQEAARRSAWAAHCDAFYSKPENAVLRDNKDIVDLVLEQNREFLAPLSVEEGFTELARLAKERLVRATGTAPELKARRTPKPPVLEGSARRDSAVTPPGEVDRGPTSLTQALKDRRRAAASAFQKGGSGAPASR